MKTILIPIFQGAESRSILRTEIFQKLRAVSGIRIVLLVPNEEKKKYFGSEFFGDNVVYEVVKNFQGNFFDKVFTFLRKNLVRTNTLRLKRKQDFLLGGNAVKYFFECIFSFVFGRKMCRKAVRWIDQNLIPEKRAKKIFDTLIPDIVFTAHIFGDMETSILKEAKRRRIKTIGLINSWDKITSRGMVRVIPDKLIVHNYTIKDEAVRFIDMSPDSVFVLGIPQDDAFFSFYPKDKEKFFGSLGISTEKRILLICPMGKTYSDVDADIINVVTNFKAQGRIPDDLAILVRFPPNDNIDVSLLRNKDLLVWEQPGVRFESTRGIDWDMTEIDVQRLAYTLRCSAMVICPPSSISVDAAIFDTPIINIRFERYDREKVNINAYYEMDHYRAIAKTGGIRFVQDENELLLWINRYANDRKLDRVGRKEIVRQQCQFLDGKSGFRIANFVLDSLG